MKKHEKIWNKGEKLYDAFCSKFPPIARANPTTFTLELFALLKEQNEDELLLREMMKEYLCNFEDTDVFVDKGTLYYKSTIARKL